MIKKQKSRNKLLRHVVLAKEHPEKIRRSETIISSLSFFSMLVLILGPALYFRGMGIEKYILMGCSAAAGINAMFWQYNSQANRGLNDILEFIDFDRLKSAAENESN